MNRNLKCKECKRDMPKEELDKECRPTWFGMYRGGKLIQWICAECWKKGVRYNRDMGE